MEFKEQYLTYNEYLDLGGSLEEEMPFNLLEFEARKIIDNMTQNRIKYMSVKPQEVKICEYKMIENMSARDETLENVSDNVISSENIDGYSVSYITGSQVQEVINLKKTELINIIKTYLGDVRTNNGTPVLYLGV